MLRCRREPPLALQLFLCVLCAVYFTLAPVPTQALRAQALAQAQGFGVLQHESPPVLSSNSNANSKSNAAVPTSNPPPLPPPAPVRAVAFNDSASSIDRLVVRPRLRQLHAAAQAQAHTALSSADNAAQAQAAAAEAVAARRAFEAEARERERRSIVHRLSFVSRSHNEARRDKRAYEQALAKGENEFVQETPEWDFEMPMDKRIKAAFEAPMLGPCPDPSPSPSLLLLHFKAIIQWD